MKNLTNKILLKPEIIQIVPYYPPHLGGMENSVEMLTSNLDSNYCNVRVITSDIDAVGINENNQKYKVTRLPGFVIANTPIIPRLFWELLKCNKGSIFHVHIAQVGIPEVSFLAAKIKKNPIIMHLHGDVEATTIIGKLLPIYKKIFLGFTLRHASKVIVPTETYKKLIGDRYNISRSKIHVIPTGIREIFFNHTNSSKQADGVFNLLFVGRLSIEKNVPMLIEAASKIDYPVRFSIIGDGPLKESIKNLADTVRNNKISINLVGKKSHKELIDYYAESNALVLASDYESQSLVVVEAMAMGLPVIVADVTAVNEIVRGSGILCDKTVDGFVQSINQIIQSDNLRSTLSAKGKIRAKQFRWNEIIKEYKGMYETYEK